MSDLHPVPTGLSVMRMDWRDLLFAHWRVPVEAVRTVLPGPLEPDVFDGSAWVGLVPFEMSAVRPGHCPVPIAHRFLECNVRTYVTVGDEPGVYFFSLDAASRPAVWAARTSFGLPYHHATMSLDRDGDRVRYRVDRGGVTSAIDWEEGHDLPTSEPGSLTWWLTERYALYLARRGVARRGRIWHPRWPLREARVIGCDDQLVGAAGISVSGLPEHVVAARPVRVKAWLPGRAP